MLTAKSKLLLFFIAALESVLEFYRGWRMELTQQSAFFVLPLLVAVAGISIISDLSKPVVMVRER
jgi:hypothetical protein